MSAGNFPSGNSSGRRWYDQDAGCRSIVDSLRLIRQDEIRDYAALLIVQVTDQLRDMLRARISSSAPRTVGIAGLKELYMAKSSNRRWYDSYPGLKKAIGGFYLLPPEGISAFAFKLHEPIHFLTLYSKVCEQLGHMPRQDDLNQITRISLFQGAPAAETFVSDLVGKELFDAIVQHTGATTT
jgi:hypothetical protein